LFGFSLAASSLVLTNLHRVGYISLSFIRKWTVLLYTIIAIIYYNWNLKCKLYKMHLFCSLHTQHRATAGHVTRLSSALSPYQLKVACITRSETKTENCMPWLQEQFCSVSKSKFSVIETQDISLGNKYILIWYIWHYNVQANEVGQLYQFRAFLPNLIIFKKFHGTRIQSQNFNCVFPVPHACFLNLFYRNQKPNTMERLSCEK